MRPILAGLALAGIARAASAQSVTVYLFDRLEQPAYARAWATMLGDQRGLPPWLGNGAQGATQGVGKQAEVEGHDVELYYACEPHNCDQSHFEMMFSDHGAQAKGVLVVDGGTPRFFGRPDATESAALLSASQ